MNIKFYIFKQLCFLVILPANPKTLIQDWETWQKN